jgi:L-lactate dehydrogenase complex protein LldF
MSQMMRRPWLFRTLGALGRFALRWSPRFLVYNRLNPWGKQRDLPPAPKKTFQQMYRQRAKKKA